MDHQGSSCLQFFLKFTQHSMLSPLWVSVPVPEAPALHRDSFTWLTLGHPFTDLLPTSLKKSFPCVPSLPQTGLGGVHWTAKESTSLALFRTPYAILSHPVTRSLQGQPSLKNTQAWTSLVAQTVKRLSTMRETRV